MSTVTAVARRPVYPELFADLTDSEATVQADGSLVLVTFTPDIDDATAGQVVALMTSTDDADMESRACLAALRDAAAADPLDADAVRAAVVAALDYLLAR